MAYSYNSTVTNNGVRDGNVLTYSDAHTILNEKSYQIWSNPTCIKKGRLLTFLVLQFLKVAQARDLRGKASYALFRRIINWHRISGW